MRHVNPPIEVRVRYASGAYVTATLGGQRCSSTHSAEQAALGLARKLWPFAEGHQAQEMTEKGLPPGESVWLLGLAGAITRGDAGA